MATLLPPEKPRFVGFSSSVTWEVHVRSSATSARPEPLSTTIVSMFPYVTAWSERRHCTVSCTPFQFRTMTQTRGSGSVDGQVGAAIHWARGGDAPAPPFARGSRAARPHQGQRGV